ncbi:MAG TPA: hypothetical protein VHO67_20930 [Polyangia bacterium]|nr:hypothetical protein [Polyangia bacterium]
MEDELEAKARMDREVVSLSGRHQMVVIRDPAGDVVRFLAPNGDATFSVLLTKEGPVLRFEGASLVLQAAGTLAVEAERLELTGRSGLTLKTGGDLDIQADGAIASEARVQTVTATHGDVRVQANDDVKLVGERVRVNC